MSLRPAIASEWLARFHGDIYGHDKDIIRMRGKELKPTKYYDKLYDKIAPYRMETIKENRKLNHEPMTERQLRTHEKITRARTFNKSQI